MGRPAPGLQTACSAAWRRERSRWHQVTALREGLPTMRAQLEDLLGMAKPLGPVVCDELRSRGGRGDIMIERRAFIGTSPRGAANSLLSIHQNLKTAKTLGLAIRQSVLARADDVIE